MGMGNRYPTLNYIRLSIDQEKSPNYDNPFSVEAVDFFQGAGLKQS